jgi:hypothetical protein
MSEDGRKLGAIVVVIIFAVRFKLADGKSASEDIE